MRVAKGGMEVIPRVPRVIPIGETSPKARRWDPLYPEFAKERRLIVPAEKQEENGWVSAPGTSHLARFRLENDKRNIAVKFIGAMVSIQFKKPTKQGFSYYRYYFGKNFDLAANVFASMVFSDHPGKIVHQMLIKGRIPYEPYA